MKRSFHCTSAVLLTFVLLLVTPFAKISKIYATPYVKSISQTIELEPSMQYEVTIRTKKPCQASATISLEDGNIPSSDIILMYDTEYSILSADSVTGEESLTSALEKGTNTFYITNTSSETIHLIVQIQTRSSMLKFLSSEIKTDEI